MAPNPRILLTEAPESHGLYPHVEIIVQPHGKGMDIVVVAGDGDGGNLVGEGGNLLLALNVLGGHLVLPHNPLDAGKIEGAVQGHLPPGATIEGQAHHQLFPADGLKGMPGDVVAPGY